MSACITITLHLHALLRVSQHDRSDTGDEEYLSM